MAGVINIPQDVFTDSQCYTYKPADRTAIRLYQNNLASVKTKVTMQTHLFSFLLEGEKVVNRPGQPIRISSGQFLLISGGRCLMTEKLSQNGNYSSLLFFFDEQVWRQFFLKYPALVTTQAVGKEPIVAFDTDPFISNYLHSLKVMLEVNPYMQQELQLLKLEELLVYLQGAYPQLLGQFCLSSMEDAGDQLLKSAVEENCYIPITVEELAFVCNMSLSTFKRKFDKLYGTSPNKWILQKRMERAAWLLSQQEKPSEIYGKLGYENHSSFSQSFKQMYGMTPRDWQKKQAGSSISHPANLAHSHIPATVSPATSTPPPISVAANSQT